MDLDNRIRSGEDVQKFSQPRHTHVALRGELQPLMCCVHLKYPPVPTLIHYEFPVWQAD